LNVLSGIDAKSIYAQGCDSKSGTVDNALIAEAVQAEQNAEIAVNLCGPSRFIALDKRC
jgi:hypothetical protein